MPLLKIIKGSSLSLYPFSLHRRNQNLFFIFSDQHCLLYHCRCWTHYQSWVTSFDFSVSFFPLGVYDLSSDKYFRQIRWTSADWTHVSTNILQALVSSWLSRKTVSYPPAEHPCFCCPRTGEMVLDTYTEGIESCCSAHIFPKQEILYQSDKTYSKFSVWVRTDEEPQNFRCFCIQFNSAVALKDRSPKGHMELTDLRVVYPIKSLYTRVYILVTAIF